MLNLESRMEILGITIFQDTDRPNQFYYLPGSPHISYERGTPLFDLFAYRKGGLADQAVSGGFLNMTVDVSIGALKDRIERQLKDQYGDDASLASVPLSKGRVRVIALGEDTNATAGAANETTPGGSPLVTRGPRFIENILGSGQPSLDGDNRAIFSFSLSQDGAAFFLGVLSGSSDARVVGVIYDLEYVGLLPAYDLEITINFKSSYDYMRTRFTLGTLFFRADVDNIVEELKRRESIKIKETARTLELSTPEAIRERQSRIDQLVKDLASGALFQPSLIPGQPRVAGETITAAQPTGEPSTTATSPSVATMNQGPSVAVAAGMGEALRPELRRTPGASGGTTPGTTTPGSTTPGTTPGTTTPGSTTPGTTAPTSSATDLWNSLGRPQAAFVLRNIHQEEERTVTYNLSQVSAQKRTVAPQSFIQFMANQRDLDKRIHVIDLNHPFFERLNININARDVNFATQGITQMTVQLRYGRRPDGSTPKDTAEVILRSADDSKDFTFFLDSALTRAFEYKLILDYRSDFGIGFHEPRVEGPWTRTETVSLAVNPNWLGRTLPVTLQLAPNIPDDVTEIQARVRYVNQAHNIDDSTLVRLTKQAPTHTVPIRLADLDEQFEVTQTLFFGDGTRQELAPIHLPDPNSGAADDALVVSAPRANRLQADVIMLDPLGELQSTIVDLQALQNNALIDSRSLELNTPGKREVWSARLPSDKPPVLRYQERRIYKDGGLETESWRDATSFNLVVGIPAEGTLRVTILYMDMGVKLSALGLSAIMVDLEYKDPGNDARFNQNTSLLITEETATHTQEWKIRLADRAARNYRWRLTLIQADGTETSTEFKADNRDKLILRTPQR
jgi:hypothetical protein